MFKLNIKNSNLQTREYTKDELFILNVVGFKLFHRLEEASKDFKKVRLCNHWKSYMSRRGIAQMEDTSGNQLHVYFLPNGEMEIIEMDNKGVLSRQTLK